MMTSFLMENNGQLEMFHTKPVPTTRVLIVSAFWYSEVTRLGSR